MDFNAIVEVVKLFFNNLIGSLNLFDIAAALIIAVSGICLAILARRITRIVKKTNDVDDDDKFMLTVKAFGLVLIFVSLLMVILQAL